MCFAACIGRTRYRRSDLQACPLGRAGSERPVLCRMRWQLLICCLRPPLPALHQLGQEADGKGVCDLDVETRNLGGGAPALLAATSPLLGSAPGERVHLSSFGPQPYLPLQAQCMQRCCHLVVILGHCPESLPLLRWGVPGESSTNHPWSAEPARPLGAAAQAWQSGTKALSQELGLSWRQQAPWRAGVPETTQESEGWCPWRAAWSRGCSAWKGYHPWQ